MDYKEIAELISRSKKKTPVKVYIRGEIAEPLPEGIMHFPGMDSSILIGEFDIIKQLIHKNRKRIQYFHMENDRRNSALPLLDLTAIDARIEPGAIIREKVKIGKRCIIIRLAGSGGAETQDSSRTI